MNPTRFRNDVDAAVAQVRALLGASRNPSFPSDVPHAYADKYSLVEIGSRQTLLAACSALDVACDGGASPPRPHDPPQNLEMRRIGLPVRRTHQDYY